MPLRNERPRLAFALQGGGAHGAFTWGVLDRLLEEEGFRPAAVSGTSAGACMAVVLAAGWMRGGAAEARAALDRLWNEVASEAERASLQPSYFGSFLLGLAFHLFSPYDLNPSGRHPLAKLLQSLVDFDRLREHPPFPLLIAATSMRTARSHLFREHELTVDHVLASACLPQIHHAVEIDGEPFCDGGYSSNPPILGLADIATVQRILLVRINPAERNGMPRSAAAIRNRIAEIVFARPLVSELDELGRAKLPASRLFALFDRRSRRLAALRVEVIDGSDDLLHLDPSTRVLPDRSLLLRLRDAGRNAADAWLAGQ